MASSGFNLTTFDPLLKDMQDGPIQDTFNSNDLLLSRIPKDDDPEGRRWKGAIRTAKTGSHGCQNIDASTPDAIASTYANPILTYKDWVGKARVQHGVLRRARTDAGSYARPMAQAIRDMVIDSADDWVRMLLGDGSASLGYSIAASNTHGASGTNSYLLKHDVVSGNPTVKEDARKFSAGMLVEAWDKNTPDAAEGALYFDNAATPQRYGTVGTANASTGAIGFTETTAASAGNEDVTDVANYYFARKGARTNTLSYEFMGLDGIIDDGDPPMNQTGSTDQVGLNALPVATNTTWKSFVDSAAGIVRPVTTRLLQNCKDGMWTNGKGKPRLIITTFGIRTEFAESQLGIRRNVNTAAISGSTTAGFVEDHTSGNLLEWDGVPIWPDKYAPKYKVLMADMDFIALKRVQKPEWVSEDGSIVRISNDGILAWEMTLYMAGNFATTNRAAHGKLEDIFEPT